MNEVATPDEFGLMPSTQLIDVISRAAADPNTDIAKLEKLLEMHERITQRQAEQDFNAAMTAAQRETHRVAADADNPQTRSRYASYAALDRALRPIYTKHGFALSFDTGESPESYLRVLCRVSHTAGFSRVYQVLMPADGKGAKGGDVMTKTHATGAAMSYGARYLLKFIFNVAVGEDDDDGNSASDESAPIDEGQLQHVRDLIERAGADIDKFCAYMHVKALTDITSRDYPRAITALNQKERKAKQ